MPLLSYDEDVKAWRKERMPNTERNGTANPRIISTFSWGLCKTFSVIWHQIKKEVVGNQEAALGDNFPRISLVDSPELYGILTFGSGGWGNYPSAGPSLQVVFKRTTSPISFNLYSRY